jgi:hypothetical protein
MQHKFDADSFLLVALLEEQLKNVQSLMKVHIIAC